jgi:predicted metal-binding membrane protein
MTTEAAAAASSYPLPRERNLILGSLLALAAAAWALLVWQWAVMGEDMSLTMGMGAPVYIALWVAMMVAIMFPTAAPMVLMFARVHNKRKAEGKPFVPTWVFTGAYILVWSATGIIAWALAAGGDAVAGRSEWISDHAGQIGGGLLIVAGVYQLTPLKNICLTKCRNPLSFILNYWRDGMGGSFRMGLDHAVFCLGCCWLLFMILLPLGMMNVAILALITILIFAEKSTAFGRQVASFAAVALVVYGAAVIASPELLPMVMSDMEGMDGMGDMEGM